MNFQGGNIYITCSERLITGRFYSQAKLKTNIYPPAKIAIQNKSLEKTISPTFKT